MAEAVKLIDQEINTIEESLKVHSYHLYALRELREKLTQEQKTRPVITFPHEDHEQGLVVRKKAPALRKKSKRVEILEGVPVGKKKYIKWALAVATEVRKNKLTKRGAIQSLITTGKIKGNVDSICSVVTPKFIGKDLHDTIFKGTKYVK